VCNNDCAAPDSNTNCVFVSVPLFGELTIYMKPAAEIEPEQELVLLLHDRVFIDPTHTRGIVRLRIRTQFRLLTRQFTRDWITRHRRAVRTSK